VNSLSSRLLFGVVMCLAVHFGQAHWDWTRSVMYGFSIIGIQYVAGEVYGRFFSKEVIK
jgi:hypothetical protein